MQQLPLEGLRVLDLSRLLPGPYCSSILADLGADVVKIEAPGGGDYLRWMPPLIEDQSGFFHALNRNKRSVALDLKRTEGVEVFRRLLKAGFDVVLESFRPGVMDRLGLGYQALKAVDPGVILCSISGYGQTGPRSKRAGHDLNFLGLSGVLGMIGSADGAPTIPGVQMADVGGGSLMGAIGILAALHRRGATGEGAWLDVSMTEGALAFSSMLLGARQAMDEPPRRGRGVLSGELPCYSVYRTSDGAYMSLAALEPAFWQPFCAAVGREDLVNLGLSTGEEGEGVRAELASIFAGRTQAEWVELFFARDVCCEPVHEGDAVFDDAHLLARDAFVAVEDPIAGSLRQLACPIRFAGEDPGPRRPAPRLGADTAALLQAVGFDSAQIEDLRAQGVIA